MNPLSLFPLGLMIISAALARAKDLAKAQMEQRAKDERAEQQARSILRRPPGVSGRQRKRLRRAVRSAMKAERTD